MPGARDCDEPSGDAGNQPVVQNGHLANGGADTYASANNLTSMGTDAVANTGGSQGHENMQPYLALNFCIALQGLFPSRN